MGTVVNTGLPEFAASLAFQLTSKNALSPFKTVLILGKDETKNKRLKAFTLHSLVNVHYMNETGQLSSLIDY